MNTINQAIRLLSDQKCLYCVPFLKEEVCIYQCDINNYSCKKASCEECSNFIVRNESVQKFIDEISLENNLVEIGKKLLLIKHLVKTLE